MKKTLFLITALVSLFFASCSSSFYDSEGVLVIENKCSDESTCISNVLAKTASDSGFHSVYSGKIESGNSYCISLTKNEYSIKVETIKEYGSRLVIKASYETGYNVYKKIDDDTTQVVTFDGSGIYFH